MAFKITAPILPGDLTAASAVDVVSDGRLDDVKIESQDASGASATGLNIEESVLDKVALTQANLEKLGMADVFMNSCDLSAAKCGDSSWIRVQVTGGRMSGVDLNKSVIKDAVFKNCKLDMANLRFAKLVRVRFEDCVLSETDFQGAELNQVEFAGCLLQKTEFGQSKLTAVDLRTSELIDLRGWQYLKGATIDSTQLISVAPQLAVALGLKLED